MDPIRELKLLPRGASTLMMLLIVVTTGPRVVATPLNSLNAPTRPIRVRAKLAIPFSCSVIQSEKFCRLSPRLLMNCDTESSLIKIPKKLRIFSTMVSTTPPSDLNTALNPSTISLQWLNVASIVLVHCGNLLMRFFSRMSGFQDIISTPLTLPTVNPRNLRIESRTLLAFIWISSSFSSISSRAFSRAGSSISSEIPPPEPPPEAVCSWSTLSSSNGAVKSFNFSAAEPAAAPIPLIEFAASSAPEVSTFFIDVFSSLKEDAIKLSIILKAIIKPLTYAIALDSGATIKLPTALPN